MSAALKWLERRRSVSAAGHGPIGVYFTREHLHLVQLSRSGDGRIGLASQISQRFSGSRGELIKSQAAVRKLVRSAMREGKFRGRKVVSALPPEMVRVMPVSYPANSTESVAVSIAKLMADRVEGPLTDYVIDYVPIRMSSHDGDRLALVAVSRLEDANAYLDALAGAGLHVDFLEIGPLAVKRLISLAGTVDNKEHLFVVNVGDEASRLTTISGERLLANQEIRFGEDRILEAVAGSLDLTVARVRDLVRSNSLDPKRQDLSSSGGFATDVSGALVEIVRPEFMRLARELERAFHFADSESHGKSRKKIIITGNIASWPGADRLLESLTGAPVECLGRKHLPFGSESVEDLSDALAAELATATGLALRGMTGDD